MTKPWRPDVDDSPWGPFVGKDYKVEAITHTDVAIASVVWLATLVSLIVAGWLAYRQCQSSRSPLRSVYIWMIWLEVGASFVMGLVSVLNITKCIRPSKFSRSLIHLQY
jgi:hypothetical protein